MELETESLENVDFLSIRMHKLLFRGKREKSTNINVEIKGMMHQIVCLTLSLPKNALHINTTPKYTTSILIISHNSYVDKKLKEIS